MSEGLVIITISYLILQRSDPWITENVKKGSVFQTEFGKDRSVMEERKDYELTRDAKET